MNINNKTYLIIITLVLCLLMTGGCSKYNDKLHSRKKIINYVDNLKCDFDEKHPISCNLKGKYEITNENISYDSKNKKQLEATFKLKDIPVTFTVWSIYECNNVIKEGCFKYNYKLINDFQKNTLDYLYGEYNKSVGYNNEYCYHQNTGECYNGAFKIKNKEEFDYVVDYMSGFLQYINSFDFKVMNHNDSFSLFFNSYGSKYEALDVYLDIDTNGKYKFKFNNLYKPSDGTLKTYLTNYLKKEKISL